MIWRIEFLKEVGELHIYIDFRKGSKFKCCFCDGENKVDIYDTKDKTWRHLNFFQYKASIHFRTPRTKCPEHGVHLFETPWGSAGSGFTLLMEAIILELAQHMPVKNIAELLEEHDTKIWRVIKKHENNARLTEDHSQIKSIGMDETSSKKGHEYVTLFVDMDKSKVVFVTEGKGSNTVKEFKEDLKDHNGVPYQIIMECRTR